MAAIDDLKAASAAIVSELQRVRTERDDLKKQLAAVLPDTSADVEAVAAQLTAAAAEPAA